MKSISELETELNDARVELDVRKTVTWGQGMIPYYNQLVKVTRLQDELNRALKADG